MSRRARRLLALYCAVLVVIGGGVGVALCRTAGPLRPIGAYSTSLKGRHDDQVYNAHLAARAIDGQVILPGETFSFNETVGSWSADAGYKRAPVSYSGELVRDWGGGVCQTSTTLYNAALLAGMDIVERHRHYWPARYVEPGRDAGVAFHNIDLRIANPYRWPVWLSAGVRGERLIVRVMARHAPREQHRVVTRVRALRPPSRLACVDRTIEAGRERTIVTGAPGCDVEVYRIAESASGEVSRERISRDVYPVLHEVTAVGAAP